MALSKYVYQYCFIIIACGGYVAGADVRAAATRRLLALFTVPRHQLGLKPVVVFVDVFLQVRQQLVGIGTDTWTTFFTYNHTSFNHDKHHSIDQAA